jgi:hypothetical protein
MGIGAAEKAFVTLQRDGMSVIFASSLRSAELPIDNRQNQHQHSPYRAHHKPEARRSHAEPVANGLSGASIRPLPAIPTDEGNGTPSIAVIKAVPEQRGHNRTKQKHEQRWRRRVQRSFDGLLFGLSGVRFLTCSRKFAKQSRASATRTRVAYPQLQKHRAISCAWGCDFARASSYPHCVLTASAGVRYTSDP